MPDADPAQAVSGQADLAQAVSGHTGLGNPSFGTDGVRGTAFTRLTEEFVARLGYVATQVLGSQHLVVGRDTRESSPRLAAALIDGARAAGAEVSDLGVVATPVVSHACGLWDCAGAMVSASHNIWTDNGVKLFAVGGTKLNDATEAVVVGQLAAEQLSAKQPLTKTSTTTEPTPTTPAKAFADYERSLAAGIGNRTLSGFSIVVDTANGATAPYAADVLRRLGAEVTALFDTPDGRNINAGCGSLHPQTLQAEVVSRGADLGLCFDGDGDRLIAVDDAGNLINGDRLLVLFATDLTAAAIDLTAAATDLTAAATQGVTSAAGTLAHRTVVTTVMSNLGLREALAAADIAIAETSVGDRNVLNTIDSGGFDLGGEQSGHIIFRRLAATGDGLRSGVQLADLVLRSNQSSSRLAASAMTEYPQVIRSVPVPLVLTQLPPELESRIDEITATAPTHSRILVRPSGTEPLVRVMVEAADQGTADRLADRLVEVVESHLG